MFFFLETLQLRDLRQGLNPSHYVRLEKALKGVRVEPTHRGGVVRRYRVMGITRTAADRTFFESQSGETTVAKYFAGNICK